MKYGPRHGMGWGLGELAQKGWKELGAIGTRSCHDTTGGNNQKDSLHGPRRATSWVGKRGRRAAGAPRIPPLLNDWLVDGVRCNYRQTPIPVSPELYLVEEKKMGSIIDSD